MATRVVEWKKPYTWGKAISIDENKVISLNLRDENNLIIYDEWDDEIYVDLQLDDEITPTSAFPIWVNVGRVIVDNWWDKPWTIISAETTSGDNIKIFYADEWTLWMDNWTWTFKQIYFKADVDALLLALRNYIDWELAKKQNWVASATAPSNPSEWDLWYDTTNSVMKVWDWTQWNTTWWEIVYATQAEYNALLPWAATDNKHYFIYSTSGGWGWQPWVNTIAYYPLDSTNTVNDLSGNWYDLTNAGNVTFSTYDWVDCAKFSASSPAWLTNTSANIINGQYTYLAWIKWDNDMWSGNPRIFWWVSSFFIILEKQYDIIHPYFSISSEWASYTSWWHLICFVGNATNGTYDTYKDWVYVSSTTGWVSWGATWIMIWANESNSSISWDRFCGYMSQVIWEDKQWTAQEISDYYDATKATYWIS